jgi:hypothetical protein
MSGPFIPLTSGKPVDSSPPVDLDDAYVDNEFDYQNFMANEYSTSVEKVAPDGFDSDFENKFPDGVPPACTISSHFLHDNDDDQDDDDDDNDDDNNNNDDDNDDNNNDDDDHNLVCQMHRNKNKY